MSKLTNNKGAFDHEMAFAYIPVKHPQLQKTTIDFSCMRN